MWHECSDWGHVAKHWICVWSRTTNESVWVRFERIIDLCSSDSHKKIRYESHLSKDLDLGHSCLQCERSLSDLILKHVYCVSNWCIHTFTSISINLAQNIFPLLQDLLQCRLQFTGQDAVFIAQLSHINRNHMASFTNTSTCRKDSFWTITVHNHGAGLW